MPTLTLPIPNLADRTVSVDIPTSPATPRVPAVPAPVVSAPDATASQAEVIAGYSLRDRLGIGGYGEVWRAVGPGGLHKAVKILHGRADGPQADAELKALERVRELRHPFLLSVERVEVAGGRLVIVTELAEGSLDDRFEACKREGKRGVPRDELLGYLRDAADALDFLYDTHGLQHLDIKPGNLLIQAGHAKVADFGLVKDIRQTQMSLVGGYTPMYAPPELFEGRPNRTSDQYSLAIVFQLALTGVAPFAGRTAAQLAAQHLSSPPDLSPLAASDRPAVARALTKNPRARFPNCREFVDALASRAAARSGPTRGPAPRADDRGSSGEPTARLDATTQTLPRPTARPPVALPPVDLAGDARLRPTLFVAVGGLGGRTLVALRRRLRARYGAEADLPALSFLYLDTDEQAIAAARGETGGLDAAETLAIPLRDAKDYRSSASDLLGWLSRRWLFNIPRSRQVEGIRPLGRLALVDHHERFRDRLGRAIGEACATSAADRTRRATGLGVESAAPDVVILASIAGGTGSGAVLDAAYLVRDVLGGLGFDGGRIAGLLLHPGGGHGKSRDVRRANALACLNELRRFAESGLGHPGDPACGLPRSDRPPFDDTYLVDLGGDESDEDFDAEIEKVAEYVYRATATPAHAFFDACRRENAEDESAAPEGVLRSFGVPSRRIKADEATTRRAAGLARHVVRQRRGDGRSEPPHPERTRPLLDELQLTTPQLVGKAAAAIRRDLPSGLDGFIHALVARVPQDGRAAEAFRLVDAALASPPADGPGHPGRAAAAIRERLHADADRCVDVIRTRLFALLDGPGGLAVARPAVRELDVALHAVAKDLTTILFEVDGELGRLARSADALGPVTAAAQRYCMLRLCGSTHRALLEQVEAVRGGLRATAETFAGVAEELRRLEEELGREAEAGGASRFEDALIRLRDEALADVLLADVGAAPALRLSGLAADPGSAERFADRLREEAVDLLLRTDADASAVAAKEAAAEPDLGAVFGTRLAGIGGRFRVLVVDRPDAAPAGAAERFAVAPTNLADANDGPFVCCELGGLSSDAVAAHVSGGDLACAEMAARLHTRTDVDWR